MIGKQGIEQIRPELGTHDSALSAVQTDLGDFSGRSYDQTLLDVIGIPDVDGKDLHTLLVTDRLDEGSYGLNALKTLLDAVPTVSEIQTEMEENGASLLDTIRDDLDNVTDGLGALKALLDAIPTTMVGTDAAFLANVGGLLNTAAATGAVDSSTLVMGYLKQLVTNSRRVVHRMVFWSEIDDIITLDATAGDETLPSVTVAEIPSGAIILRVNAILSIGAFEDTSTAENSVVLSAAEHIQIDKTGATFVDAIKMVAGMWLTGASAVRGGLVMIGDIDVASEVDANDTYELRIENADVTGASLLLRDVQTGLIVYFTLE